MLEDNGAIPNMHERKLISKKSKSQYPIRRIGKLYFLVENDSVADKDVEVVNTELSQNEEVHKVESETLMDLHARLGHVNAKTILETIKSGALEAKLSDKVIRDCGTCIKSKMTEKPFKKNGE